MSFDFDMLHILEPPFAPCLFLLLLGHEVRCIIVIENWSRWMLNFPVVYTQYGDFQYGFHEREIFPAHREIVVAVNELDSITGSSGTIAWELVSHVETIVFHERRGRKHLDFFSKIFFQQGTLRSKALKRN